jgi:hypothetical protein
MYPAKQQVEPFAEGGVKVHWGDEDEKVWLFSTWSFGLCSLYFEKLEG